MSNLPDTECPLSGVPLALADDNLDGANAIAAFIGQPRRRTIYLLECGYIPAGKIGNRWTASKRKIRAHYDAVTGGRAA